MLAVHVFHLVSLLFIAVIDPYSPFKIMIFKLFLYVYFYGLAIASFWEYLFNWTSLLQHVKKLFIDVMIAICYI